LDTTGCAELVKNPSDALLVGKADTKRHLHAAGGGACDEGELLQTASEESEAGSASSLGGHAKGEKGFPPPTSALKVERPWPKASAAEAARVRARIILFTEFIHT
jgi:hypothetical protein